MSSYPLFIGLRYSFSKRRQRLATFIATASTLGMVLGVASLITVLSVMNGFAGEMRERILSLVPHGFVLAAQPLTDWQVLAGELQQRTTIMGAAPFIQEKVIVSGLLSVQGAELKAVSVAGEAAVSKVASSMTRGNFEQLNTPFSTVLGIGLAQALGVNVGDKIIVTLPRLNITPLGVFPRTKTLTVVGLFEVGAQLDRKRLYVSLATGQKLLGLKQQVSGIQLKTEDLMTAPEILGELKADLGDAFTVKDWTQTQGSLFRAVKMEKLMVTLLLFAVVAVAAFNIISTLALSVTEKRGDIAVLRALGASRTGVLKIFLIHGLALSSLGILLGVVMGVTLALNIASIVTWCETVLGVHLFDPNVYFITQLPSVLLWWDVFVVACTSLVLSFLASLYPAWRAANVAPADILRDQ